MLPQYFPQGSVVGEGPLYYNQPYFLAYRVPGGTRAQIDPPNPTAVDWDGKITLWGYGLDVSEYQAGETIHLVLYYGAQTKMDASYTVFGQLWGPPNLTDGGPIWGQDDTEPCRRGYPTSSWRVGEVLVDNLEISIPVDALPGDYSIVMGFYQWPSLERLPVRDALGLDVVDNVVVLAHVHVVTK
jgi:hypothetical protein